MFYLKLPVTFGIYLFPKLTNLIAYSLIVTIDLCLMRFLCFILLSFLSLSKLLLPDFLFNEIYYYSIILYFSVEFDVFSCILNYYRIVNFLCVFFKNKFSVNRETRYSPKQSFSKSTILGIIVLALNASHQIDQTKNIDWNTLFTIQ